MHPQQLERYWLAGTKKAGFAAAISVIVLGMFVLNVDWTLYLAIIAIFTMTLGNLGALTQKKYSKNSCIFKYRASRLHNDRIGPCTICDQALTGSLFHIMNHAVMKSAAFIAAAGVSYGPCRIQFRKVQRIWMSYAYYGNCVFNISSCTCRSPSPKWILEQASNIWGRNKYWRNEYGGDLTLL